MFNDGLSNGLSGVFSSEQNICYWSDSQVWLIKQGTLCLELAVLSLVHPVVCFCHSVSELRSDMSTLPIQPNLCILTQGTLPVLGILHKQVGKIKYGTCIIVFQLTIYIALLNYHIVKVQTQILYQEVSFAHGVAPRTIQFFTSFTPHGNFLFSHQHSLHYTWSLRFQRKSLVTSFHTRNSHL